MKKMLWGGRFGKPPSDRIIAFNSGENVRLDAALIPYDILGSLAHVQMLYEAQIISTADYESIRKALRTVYRRWDGGVFILDPRLEDVHMNVEAAVSALTPAGKKMHTARSRNDQALLDMRLFMRDRILAVIESLGALRAAFAGLSKAGGPMVAYTHTRAAQPVTVSFWCDAWVSSLARDIDRLAEAYRRVNQNPLGACAVAGTPWKIDRGRTAALLAMESVQENEMDAISSRGECEAEVLGALSLAMCKLSRLSEELIWLSEKGLLSISEEHTTGSSIMPNKKNPDALELIRGRSARVYGALFHALASLKGLPGGYNSDMQETKAAVMGGLATAQECAETAALIVAGISFDSAAIREELERGFCQATEVADRLAMGGMPFREAHEKAGGLVRYCEGQGKTIGLLDAAEASKALGVRLSEAQWGPMKSLERPGLECRVRAPKPALVDRERKRIMAAFTALV